MTHGFDPRKWPKSLTHESDPRVWTSQINHHSDPQDPHNLRHLAQSILTDLSLKIFWNFYSIKFCLNWYAFNFWDQIWSKRAGNKTLQTLHYQKQCFLIIHFTNIYKPMFHFYTSWKHQKTRGETLVENGLKFKKN